MNNYSVLFICLGNICRSPVAEAVFRDKVAKSPLAGKISCESRGTGSWHIGHQAHPNSRQTAKDFGIDLESHRARQLSTNDTEEFDLLIVMDSSNHRDTLRLASKDNQSKVKMLREFDEEALKHEMDVPDPFFGEGDGFVVVHNIIDRSCNRLLEFVGKAIS